MSIAQALVRPESQTLADSLIHADSRAVNQGESPYLATELATEGPRESRFVIHGDAALVAKRRLRRSEPGYAARPGRLDSSDSLDSLRVNQALIGALTCANTRTGLHDSRSPSLKPIAPQPIQALPQRGVCAHTRVRTHARARGGPGESPNSRHARPQTRIATKGTNRDEQPRIQLR